MIQNAAHRHFPGYLIQISWWIWRILVEGKYLKAALRHSPVREPAVCVSISGLLCPEGWKRRPKRGVKDQFPEAKLGDRESCLEQCQDPPEMSAGSPLQ